MNTDIEKNKSVKNGKLILAEPYSANLHFRRSVILLCNHDDEGSFGYIINKPLDTKLNELIPDFPLFKAPLFYGGPVQTNTLHFIHNLGDLIEGSVRISAGVYMGGSWDNLKFLVEAKLIEPKHVRFFVGYSGWGEKQLQEEIEIGSWILADMHANYLFNAQPNTLWRTVLQNKGDAYAIIADMSDDNRDN